MHAMHNHIRCVAKPASPPDVLAIHFLPVVQGVPGTLPMRVVTCRGALANRGRKKISSATGLEGKPVLQRTVQILGRRRLSPPRGVSWEPSAQLSLES